MPRMYHPDLGVEEEVPDDEACVGVLKESGWKVAPEPEPAGPGLVPEPVTYEPVTAKSESDKPSAKKPSGSKSTTDSTDGD